ncbi:MAG TPA: ATP-binding cassette domain-containing protein, partial [Spirochaetota bacterium]|nr:ATP-binding cassette domain-containing protein [Spirochaetota bacterium]
MDSLLLIENLKKDFVTKTETLNILNGVNLRLEYGETISITGESGSGKSTFLNMIGGLDCVTSGSVKIDGVEISN